ncbi:YoaK family protein [Ileibacterium valens]|uniref:YoaK family protein n=1 Tax=Ileibacterium valens TaxID=1862668 RepID=UPI002573A72C|nr:YoaK family protein [Ileibacterium valens]
MKVSIRTSQKQMSESYWIAFLITISGGLQDVYSYFVRGHVFANAQTGNIIFLAMGIADRNLEQIIRYLIPLAFFMSGILIAQLIRMRLHHKRLHWRQWILLLEILLLAVVPFIQSDLIANSLISMSCAIQVQSFRKIHGHPFASTMCIGNMRNMMDNLAMFIHTKDQMYLKYSAGYLRIIFYFILGCLLGGLLMIKMGIYTIMISVLLLFAAFIMMFYHSESEELKELENEYSNFTKHFNEQ